MKKGYALCHPERKHKAHGLCDPCWKRARYKYDPEKSQRARLKHYYGLSTEAYNALVAKQNGVCAICGQPPRGKMKRLSVDHNHTTGEVRGLLCITCNRVAGYLDNKPWLAAASKYLGGA